MEGFKSPRDTNVLHGIGNRFHIHDAPEEFSFLDSIHKNKTYIF